VRTIVEVETDDGYVGLGEMGGGGEDATRAFTGLLSYLKGHDVFRLEAMRFAICNPTASLYNNRTQLHAALEFACLDIMGQKLGVPVHALLGGKLRDAVDFASYLFFRYANPDSGEGEVRTPEQLVANAAELKAKHGFTSHKLKGGVYPPDYELTCYRALAAPLPGERFRYDPNSALSPTPSRSARGSPVSATTISRTRCGACRSSSGSRNSCRCPSRPTRW
jgi:glucarate dehydratase